MPRTITPAQQLSLYRAALRVAIEKGLHSEARQVTSLIRDLKATIARQEA